MDEWIQALVAVLEKGIVVEPYGQNWSSRSGAIRIRLAPDETEEQPTEQQGTRW